MPSENYACSDGICLFGLSFDKPGTFQDAVVGLWRQQTVCGGFGNLITTVGQAVGNLVDDCAD